MHRKLAVLLPALAVWFALTLAALAAGPNGTLSVQLYSWTERTRALDSHPYQ